MSNHLVLLEIARMRQQDMFRQAETERLYRLLKPNRPTVLQQVGGCWPAVVGWLQGRSQSTLATPVFGQKQLTK